MTDETGRRQNPDRRNTPRRTAEAAPPERRGKSLIVAGPSVRQDRIASERAESLAASASYAAQLLGQPGMKRGLKGGPEVIDGARSAYLETNYLGQNERRAPLGVIAKKDI